MDVAARGVPWSSITLRRDSGMERDSVIVPTTRCPRCASIATSCKPSRSAPSTIV